MLAAPVVIDGEVVGCFFADTLLGQAAPLADDLRLAALVAGLIGRTVAMAGQGLAERQEMSREVAFLRSKVSLRYRHVFSTGGSSELLALRGETDRAALTDDRSFVFCPWAWVRDGRSVRAMLKKRTDRRREAGDCQKSCRCDSQEPWRKACKDEVVRDNRPFFPKNFLTFWEKLLIW